MQNQISENKHNEQWTNTQIQKLIQTISVVVTQQNDYGKEVNVIDTIEYFKMKLQSRYTVDQVIYAIDIFTDRSDRIPTPADLIKILDPEQPRITEAQYVEACRYQERNGFPSYSDAALIKKQYEDQEKDRREEAQPITDERVKGILDQSIKKIC
jgi:hypothetical protein